MQTRRTIHVVGAQETNHPWGFECKIIPAFGRLGYRVLSTDYRKNRARLGEILVSQPADVVLVCRGEQIPQEIIRNLPSVTALWYAEQLGTLSACDERAAERRKELSFNIAAFDHVFSHDEAMLPVHSMLGAKRADWLATAVVDPLVNKRLQVSVKRDVVFTGSMTPYRESVLNGLKERGIRVDIINSWDPKELNRVYNESRIILNIHLSAAPNTESRITEVLGSGGFLISQELSSPGLVRDGHDYVSWSGTDVDALAKLIEFYLKNDADRRKIAAQGYATAQARHTVDRRIEQFMTKVDLSICDRIWPSSGFGILRDKDRNTTLRIDDFYAAVRRLDPPMLTRPNVEERTSPAHATPQERQLNLLLVAHAFLPESKNGTEIHTCETARELMRRGSRVRVLYPKYALNMPEGILEEDVYDGIPVARVTVTPGPKMLMRNDRVAAVVGDYARSLQVDLVHFQHLIGVTAAAVGAVASRNIPSVLTLRDGWLLCEQIHLIHSTGEYCSKGPENVEKCVECLLARYGQRSGMRERSAVRIFLDQRNRDAHLALEAVEHLITPSQFLKTVFTRHGIEHANMTVIPHGVREFATRTWIPAEGRVRFVYLGSIYYTKGLDIALRALASIKASNIEFRIYGHVVDPQYFDQVMRLAARDERVRYMGPYDTNDLGRIFSEADVTVLPSRIESYSHVVRESFRASVPVIASRIGGLPEAIVDRENGLLFAPGDPEDLARAMKVFVEAPGQIQACRQRVHPPRTMRENVDDIEKIYRSVISRRPVGDSRPTVDQDRPHEQGQSANMPPGARRSANEDARVRDHRKSSGGVSIIIPVFNSAHFTRQCLKTLYENTAPETDFEVIVVDNASTDETPELLVEAARTYPRLRFIRNAENLKFARACNQGARAANGRTLVFLNNDTEPLTGWLDTGLERLSVDRSIGIVGSKLLYPDGTVQHCGIEFIKHMHLMWPQHRYRHASGDDPAVNEAGEMQAVTGACLFIRADLFRSAGGFDEKYGMYFEDTDLCFAVRKMGKKVYYEPKSVLIHYEGKSSTSQKEIDELNMPAARRFYSKWGREVLEMELAYHTAKREGKYIYLRETVWPAERADEAARHLQTFLQIIPEFYAHVGGIEEALLLLSTFYDKSPGQTIVSVTDSAEAMKGLFDAFPSLKTVYSLPLPRDPGQEALARTAFGLSVHCLGMGVTPGGGGAYKDEWKKGIDIFSRYRIKPDPRWAKQFKGRRIQSAQVTVQLPANSAGNNGSSRGVADADVWNRLLGFLNERQVLPVIVGAAEDQHSISTHHRVIDRRSRPLDEQLRLIASSDLFIGGEAWGKTLAALAGVPSLIVRTAHVSGVVALEDPADHVFLDPWKEITTVNTIGEFERAFVEFVRATRLEIGRLRIAWEGSQNVYHSLALINRELCLHVAAAGHDLSIIPYEPDQFKPEKGSPLARLRKFAQKPLDHVDVHVRHHWPPNLKAPNEGHWVIIQPWEFGSLPKEWVSVFATQVDEMWVPSTYVRQVYIESGVPADRVVVVPNGIDPKKFHPGVKPYPLKTSKRFRFLFVGGTIHRKGIDILVDTYLKTFSRRDDVCLVIKDMGGDSFYKGQNFKARVQEIQQQPDVPEILYIDSILSEQDLVGLYTVCNALVHPYRGEGFGLPILEAMACGTPAIVTNGGACLDFCDSTNSLFIRADKVVLNQRMIGDKETVNNLWLYEPDPASLAEQMRHAVANPDAMKELGAAASAFVRGRFTWEAAFKRLEARCAALRMAPIRRFETTGDKPDAGQLLLRAVEFMRRGEGESAREALDRAESLYAALPTSDVAFEERLFVLKGSNALAGHNLQEAKRWFEQALAVQPNSSLACVGLGEVFSLAGLDSQAKTMFEWAARLDPTNESALRGLTRVNARMNLAPDHSALERPDAGLQVEVPLRADSGSPS